MRAKTCEGNEDNKRLAKEFGCMRLSMRNHRNSFIGTRLPRDWDISEMGWAMRQSLKQFRETQNS